MAIHFSDSKFDLRTLKRYLREGKITQKEVDNYIKILPDETKKAKEVVLAEGGGKTALKQIGAARPQPTHKEPTFAPASEL